MRTTGAFLLGLALLAGACATSTPQTGELNGDPRAARKRLAYELLTRGEYRGALAYVDELRREDPDDLDLALWRGIALREQGMLEDAERTLADLLKKDDDRADAHAAIGVVYDLSHRGDKATPHHKKALALKPDDAGLLNNLGFSLFLHGRPREALPHLQRAAQIEPTNRRIRTNLGFAYAATSDFTRAAREFELGGTPAEARNNLGYAYERQGNLQMAFDLYAEAVRLEPTSARARTNLEHVARKLERPLPEDLPPSAANQAALPPAVREEKTP